MLACEGKLSHLGLINFPKRSTLSDANANRSSEVFATICYSLLDKYAGFLSDSSSLRLPMKHLKIVDSTIISLFRDILKGVARNPINGKKKDGIKMHTVINAMEDVPCLVRFSSAATHDHTFLKELELRRVKKTWAFSNMISIVRLHLMSYINLFNFLENPTLKWDYLTTKPPDTQLSFF